MSTRRLLALTVAAYAANFLYLCYVTATCPDCQEDQK